jgi:hypothetical protein
VVHQLSASDEIINKIYCWLSYLFTFHKTLNKVAYYLQLYYLLLILCGFIVPKVASFRVSAMLLTLILRSRSLQFCGVLQIIPMFIKKVA